MRRARRFSFELLIGMVGCSSLAGAHDKLFTWNLANALVRRFVGFLVYFYYFVLLAKIDDGEIIWSWIIQDDRESRAGLMILRCGLRKRFLILWVSLEIGRKMSTYDCTEPRIIHWVWAPQLVVNPLLKSRYMAETLTIPGKYVSRYAEFSSSRM